MKNLQVGGGGGEEKEPNELNFKKNKNSTHKNSNREKSMLSVNKF